MSVRLWGDDFSYLWRVTSVCFFVGMTACPGFGDKTIEDFNSPDDSVVTWDSHVSEILTAKCGSCHSSPSAGGAPASFRLDRYDRQEADNSYILYVFCVTHFLDLIQSNSKENSQIYVFLIWFYFKILKLFLLISKIKCP